MGRCMHICLGESCSWYGDCVRVLIRIESWSMEGNQSKQAQERY